MLRSTRWMMVCAALTACGQARPAEKTRAPAPPVVAERAAAEPLVPPDRTPLADRLAREAGEHPEAVAEVERQLTAFAASGVQLTRTRQVLAGNRSAHFCKTGLTSAGLAFSVCVFGSQAEAEAGKQRSRATFDALIPGRSLLVRGATLLVITRPASPAAERELALLQDRFMHPRGAEHAAL